MKQVTFRYLSPESFSLFQRLLKFLTGHLHGMELTISWNYKLNNIWSYPCAFDLWNFHCSWYMLVEYATLALIWFDDNNRILLCTFLWTSVNFCLTNANSHIVLDFEQNFHKIYTCIVRKIIFQPFVANGYRISNHRTCDNAADTLRRNFGKYTMRPIYQPSTIAFMNVLFNVVLSYYIYAYSAAVCALICVIIYAREIFILVDSHYINRYSNDF